MLRSSPSHRQRLNLEQVLLWFVVLTSFFLALTLINYVWPFANPNQPAYRLRVGLMYDVSAFSFAAVAYFTYRARWLRTCLAVVAIWALANASYGVGVLFFEPVSAWAVGICLGQLLVSAVLIYFAVLEFRRLIQTPAQ